MGKVMNLFLFLILSDICLAYYSLELGDYHSTTDRITKPEFKKHSGYYIMCAGDKKIIPVWIKNFEVSANFEFYVNKNWVSLSGNNLKLLPNQEGVVFLVLNPDIGMEGINSFDLSVKTNNFIRKLPIDVYVKRCYGVDLAMQKRLELCSCSVGQIAILIENLGETDEWFDLEIKAPNWINLTKTKLSLSPKSKSLIGMNYMVPCDISGDYEVKVVAKMERNTEVKDIANMKIKVYDNYNCYRAKIIAHNLDVDYSGGKFPIKLVNTGIKEAAYQLTTNLDWVKIKPSVLLSPNEEITVLLDIKPRAITNPGTYRAIITAKYNNLEYRKEIKIKLKKKFIFKSLFGQIITYRYYLIVSALLVLICFLRFKFKIFVLLLIFLTFIGIYFSNQIKQITIIVLNKIKEFFLIYYFYILLGTVILLILIVLLKIFSIFKKKK